MAIVRTPVTLNACFNKMQILLMNDDRKRNPFAKGSSKHFEGNIVFSMAKIIKVPSWVHLVQVSRMPTKQSPISLEASKPRQQHSDRSFHSREYRRNLSSDHHISSA
jgi:hypothetical protein